MSGTTVAIYIDLENLHGQTDIDVLMKFVAARGPSCTCAVKAAYGTVASIPRGVRERLAGHNFLIVDTPHVAKKKNRADLMISVDAFDRFHVNCPPIDRFVFVTSDSDFSVIMDKLRGYGREVWLVCRRADKAKKVLAQSCDKLLFVEDFLPASAGRQATADNDLRAEDLFRRALVQLGTANLPIEISAVGDVMKKIDSGFSYRGTRFKRLTDLAVCLEQMSVIRLGHNAKGTLQIEDVDDSRLSFGQDRAAMPAGEVGATDASPGLATPAEAIAVTATMTEALAPTVPPPPEDHAQLTIWPL